jgi:hypothetical protein
VFNEQIERVRSELRRNEEQFKADLQGKEAQISALRNSVLSGSANRQALADKRRLEAVEKVWIAVNDFAMLKSLAQTMALLNFDKIAERADDPKMQTFLQMVGGGVELDTSLKNVARDEEHFLPELAWAYFEAYKTILYSALARYKVLRLGEKDAGRYLSTGGPKKILKAAVPHHADWIENNEPSAYYYLLEEVQKLLLTELRKIIDGQASDRDAAQRAKDIIDAINNVQQEEDRLKAETATSQEHSVLATGGTLETFKR